MHGYAIYVHKTNYIHAEICMLGIFFLCPFPDE